MLLKDKQADKIIISQISIYFLFGFKALSGHGEYRNDKNIYRYFTYNQEIKIAQTEVCRCRERRLTLSKRNTKESDFDKHCNHQNSLIHIRLR